MVTSLLRKETGMATEVYASEVHTGAQNAEHGTGRPLAGPVRWRVAVVGGGIAGLSCARELSLRGHHPVVFEASGRLGGRCSSISTPAGVFDDAAQLISGANRLSSYASVMDDELPALNLWTVPGAPAEDEDDDAPPRAVTQPGLVGVPSMRALADAIARPMETRLHQPIVQARRQGDEWVLTGAGGDVDGIFQAVVLALPAPLALPLAQPSALVTSALQAVRYRNRWVLMVGTERPVGLPAYRTFEGSPIERVAAMHAKPGRVTQGPQRWFIEADARWSTAHAGDDPETVTERLLDIFSAHARRPVLPSFIRAQNWQHAFVEQPAFTMGRPACLWDETTRLGVCGDSVTASAVDRVHRSGVNLALTVAHSFDESRPRRGRRVAASWDSPVRSDAAATTGG
jgi:hypothetical protein